MKNEKLRKFYEEAIAESKLKQRLIRTGIKVLITEKPDDLDCIQSCFDVLRKEHSQQTLNEQLLSNLYGKFEKPSIENGRERAKEILGLKREGA